MGWRWMMRNKPMRQEGILPPICQLYASWGRLQKCRWFWAINDEDFQRIQLICAICCWSRYKSVGKNLVSQQLEMNDDLMKLKLGRRSLTPGKVSWGFLVTQIISWGKKNLAEKVLIILKVWDLALGVPSVFTSRHLGMIEVGLPPTTTPKDNFNNSYINQLPPTLNKKRISKFHISNSTYTHSKR